MTTKKRLHDQYLRGLIPPQEYMSRCLNVNPPDRWELRDSAGNTVAMVLVHVPYGFEPLRDLGEKWNFQIYAVWDACSVHPEVVFPWDGRSCPSWRDVNAA